MSGEALTAFPQPWAAPNVADAPTTRHTRRAMTGRDDFYHSARFEDPTDALEREKRRLGEVGELWKTETTTLRAKDQSFSVTFDGRGDLTNIVFNGTRYRTMAPAEFASLLVSTLQAGRLKSLEKVAAVMSESMPGVDFLGLATGQVEPREVLDSMIGPLLEDLESGQPLGRPAAARSDPES